VEVEGAGSVVVAGVDTFYGNNLRHGCYVCVIMPRLFVASRSNYELLDNFWPMKIERGGYLYHK
jgi:hypothetical protein